MKTCSTKGEKLDVSLDGTSVYHHLYIYFRFSFCGYGFQKVWITSMLLDQFDRRNGHPVRSFGPESYGRTFPSLQFHLEKKETMPKSIGTVKIVRR